MDKNLLKQNPFNLSDEKIAWVESTRDAMTQEEKISQLFCLIAYASDDDYLKNLVGKYTPGGVMCRPMPLEETVKTVTLLQQGSKIPLLISANLEKGGNGFIQEGTSLGSPMQVAATNDVATAEHLGEVCGYEGSAAGANWSFAPIIDIDYNFRNPITNTRTFGSDPERVKQMGVAYVRGVQKHGVAASIKHFPGDGCDERDQHLVTSVNDLSCEAWDATYGEAYKASIEEGAMTCMIGHISHPAYSRHFNPALADQDILPASLSKELVTDLLRGKLNFNGLIVTDATTMAGMIIPVPRRKAVPLTIAAGCDMFLFTRSIDEDYRYMTEGVENGTITQERLEDAVTRILATKAALNLVEKQADGTLIPTVESASSLIGQEIHQQWSKDCADKGITLVKEEAGVLPMTPAKYKKILLHKIESEQGVAYSVTAGIAEKVITKLEAEGFDIDVFAPKPGYEGMMESSEAVANKYDLILYICNMATKSNQTVVRIEWAQPMGANVPVYGETVPTIFVSVENPYHLIDVPRVKTFINTFASTENTLTALVEKLVGKSTFKGVNPSDPFCGRWDTHL